MYDEGGQSFAGYCTVVANNTRVLVTTKAGELILLDATANEYTELGKLAVLGKRRRDRTRTPRSWARAYTPRQCVDRLPRLPGELTTAFDMRTVQRPRSRQLRPSARRVPAQVDRAWASPRRIRSAVITFRGFTTVWLNCPDTPCLPARKTGSILAVVPNYSMSRPSGPLVLIGIGGEWGSYGSMGKARRRHARQVDCRGWHSRPRRRMFTARRHQRADPMKTISASARLVCRCSKNRPEWGNCPPGGKSRDRPSSPVASFPRDTKRQHPSHAKRPPQPKRLRRGPLRTRPQRPSSPSTRSSTPFW